MCLMGVPAHLWGRNSFKKVGGACNGFVAESKDTAY